jgi:hypothetical protein
VVGSVAILSAIARDRHDDALTIALSQPIPSCGAASNSSPGFHAGIASACAMSHVENMASCASSACIKSSRPPSFFHLTFDESEKVGVDPLRIDDCDTVSATLVDFQDRVRNDRWYAAASRTDRHDLIVFAVYDE